MKNPPPIQRARQSSDNIEVVNAMDAAESRAAAALRLMKEERTRADAAEAELERMRQSELQRQLEAVVKASQAQPRIEKKKADSVRPGVLMVHAKGLKVGIPLAMLMPVLAFVWAGYQNYTDLQRRVKGLETIQSNKDARIDVLQQQVTELSKDSTDNRTTLANLSGYLTGVLPKAGVNVPGTGLPIQSDPLPPGARRPTPVNVRTPVPTPPSK